MTTAIVTHADITKHRGWTIEEVHRVLDKLEVTDAPLLRLDPGFPLDLAESLAHRGHGLTVVPAQPNWLPMWAAFKRHHAQRRLTHLLTEPEVVRPRFLAPSTGGKRVDFAERDLFLARECDTHVVVYDGRERGSVVRYLQHVLGIQPTVLIDPTAKRVTKPALPEEVPCPSTSMLALPSGS